MSLATHAIGRLRTLYRSVRPRRSEGSDTFLDPPSLRAGGCPVPRVELLEARLLLDALFGPEQVISTAAYWARSVYATDLDGDGDADVLSASGSDDKIAWYENLGGGAFSAQKVISTIAAGLVYATDLDGDGDADVLSASFWDD